MNTSASPQPVWRRPTCNLINVRLLSRQLLSGHVRYWSEDGDRPQEPGWGEIQGRAAQFIPCLPCARRHYTTGYRPACGGERTFPEDHSLVGWELGLHRLGRQVLPALAEIPLGAAKAPEPPEVSAVPARCLRKRVLHTG